MQNIHVELKNCYGIKWLNERFDFSKQGVYAVYAPNGVMKSSFAQTFDDISKGQKPKDRLFPDRKTMYRVVDENGNPVSPDSIFVMRPYDEEFGPDRRVSSLLIDPRLQKEYETLQSGVTNAREALIAAIRATSGSPKWDFQREISVAFTSTATEFDKAISSIRLDIANQHDTPFAGVKYEVFFEEAVSSFLRNNAEVRQAIDGYVTRYNQLLSASTYFKRGKFDYYNANEIAKNLGKHGFFDANHTITLNDGSAGRAISTQKGLVDVITKEKEAILQDSQLRKEFDNLQKELERNINLREFYNYLLVNESLASRLSDMELFRRDILKSYIKANDQLYLTFLEELDAAEKRTKEITNEAAQQRTQWEEVVDIFNARFIVPFRIHVKNRTGIVLGNEHVMALAFTYDDGAESCEVEGKVLVKALSMGERKALYILNLIFELKRREKEGQETLIIVDDIADSFDYQNKYAIIQYLRELSLNPLFKQIILTHNFDFFRTVKLRFVHEANNCKMAAKTPYKTVLSKAFGVANVFIDDWKKNLFTDNRKKIGGIAFVRNLIEYTRGNCPDFRTLTSLLHWKPDTLSITVGQLEDIYRKTFNIPGKCTDSTPVIQLIDDELRACRDDISQKLENKVVMSIGIRVFAERYISARLDDPEFLASIDKNQTFALVQRFSETFKDERETIAILEQVSLMTPDNVHLNSFMYEPLIDMSDHHLRRLAHQVSGLTYAASAKTTGA